jgi:predicted nucleic acid-binding protein
VISYLTARKSRDVIVAGHQQATKEWWQKGQDRFELYISMLVEAEIGEGDTAAAAKRIASVAEIPRLTATDAALELNKDLVEFAAFPPKATNDALHLAIATVNGMEYLVTWNCRHLANATLRRVIEAICRRAGFESPLICTPLELMGDFSDVS